jgi:hypothetical protein
MLTPKITLTLLTLLCSSFVIPQTFVLNGANYIGKTKEEVSQVMETANSKLFRNEEYGHITQLVYLDSLNSTAHHFIFTRTFSFGPQKCFSYFVNIDCDRFEKTKADLLAKCGEKISDKAAIQVSGKKKYVWHFIGTNKSNLCSFSVEKYRKGHNYH